MISTSNLGRLPDIKSLLRMCQAIAALDAVLSPEWDMRYYSFNAKWAPGKMMASMRNGSGDQWFALFADVGAVILGLAHECDTFVPGKPQAWVYAGLPEAFHDDVLKEVAFEPEHVSFCVWRLANDPAWSCGAPPQCEDGSESLLTILDGDPGRYLDFAAEYYERTLSLDDVAAVYNLQPFTQPLIERLNPDLTVGAVKADLEEIGYPTSG